MHNEHELQTSVEILDNVSDSFLSLDCRFNVIYLNKEAEKFFMLSRETMIGQNFFALRPQAIGSELHEKLSIAMNSKGTTTFNHRGILSGKSYEVKAYSSDKGLSLYFQDITERKKNEERIIELAAIVESSGDAIISVTLDGFIKSFNPGATDTYGYSFEEVKEKHISLIFLNKHEFESKEFLQLIQQGESIKNFQTKHLTKSGGVVTVLLSMFPITNKEGIIQGFSIISRDISEHQRIEREIAKLERLNLIGHMAAGIAHEIRNPMTTVKGFLQLLLGKTSFSNEKPHLELMIKEIDRTNKILTELLSLGKEKPGDPKKLNLNSLLEEIYPLLLSDAINSNIEFELELGNVSDLFLNENEAKQLIFNLFRNGLEAMHRRGKLIIKTFTVENSVVLAVRDEGCGINKDIQKKIGTPFLTTKDNGTGLGLAVCNSIADRNDAIMDFTTGPEGTTFFVRFKLKQSDIYTVMAR